jgi:sugar/nucleoside kinase (ribokinase family)
MPETQTGLRRLLKDTSLFLPNLDEARAITGIDQPEPAARVLQMLGPAELVVKCGARGSQGLSADQAYWLPARPVIALDAVGAGDVFNAGFLAARLQGWDFPTCQAFGSASASLYISRPADRFPTFQQTLAAAQDYPLFNPLQEPHP